MEFTEAELLEAFDEVNHFLLFSQFVPDSECCVCSWIRKQRLLRMSQQVPKWQATVEILCYDDDEVEDISGLLDSAIEDLLIKDKIYPELRNTIMNDIILVYGPKSLMYRKYSELLQKQYHMTSLDPPESCIKKLLTTVVPRVILLRTKPTSQPSSISLDSAVTVDDAKVLKYISGALLRWGLKTFKGDAPNGFRVKFHHQIPYHQSLQTITKGI